MDTEDAGPANTGSGDTGSVGGWRRGPDGLWSPPTWSPPTPAQPPATDLTVSGESSGPGGTPWAPQPGGWAPGPSSSATPYWSGQPAPRPGRRRGRIVVGTVVVAMVAVVAVLATTGGSSADATVIAAVKSTLADRSAHMSMTMSGTVGGHSISGTGTGSIDFSQNTGEVQVTTEVAGQSIDETDIYVRGTVYFHLARLAQIGAKPWVSIDLSSLVPSGKFGVGNNPASGLEVLSQQASSVTPLGASTVNGVAVQGYTVVISKAELRAEMAKLPSWMAGIVKNVQVGQSSYQVYIDSQGRVESESFSVPFTIDGVSTTMNESVAFSDFGTPVSVEAPPPSDVETLQQLLAQAGSNTSTL